MVKSELHHFADVLQEHGYGTVSYKSYLSLANESGREFRDEEVPDKVPQQGGHRPPAGIDGTDVGYAREHRERTARKTQNSQNHVLERFGNRLKVHREQNKKFRQVCEESRCCHQTRVKPELVAPC